METLITIEWIIAGFVAAVAVRHVFSIVRNGYAAYNDAYAQEVNDVLTKDEYKVKGRFE